MSDCIQIVSAIILFATLVVLSITLCTAYKTYKETQSLNQALCAVKNLKVDEVKDRPIGKEVYKISATIANTGNYVGEKASINWETFLVENLKDVEPKCTKIEKWSWKTKKSQITILPRHEFDVWMYVDKKPFEENIEGNAKAIGIKLTIQYTNAINKENKTYSGSYIVSRMLQAGKDTLDVAFTGSEFETLKYP